MCSPITNNIFAQFQTKKLPVITKQVTPVLSIKETPTDKFISSAISDKINVKNLSVAAMIGMLGLFSAKPLTKILKINYIKKAFSKTSSAFPQDLSYKKLLANELGISGEEYKLNSIVGAHEFSKIIEEFSENPIAFSVGEKLFDNKGVTIGFKKENVENCLFGLNLHIHTVNSDGKLTVKELLEKSAAYADIRMKKTKKPFVIALTDHDSILGNIEALKILKKNPYKYRNLKVVLGIENTAEYTNPSILDKVANIHILSYAINPYEKGISEFLLKRVNQNKANIQKVLNNANKIFADINIQYKFNYSFNELTDYIPALKGSVRNAQYYMKDYLQFKLIFQCSINQNQNLLNYLRIYNLNVDNLNYKIPVLSIPKNPDYSKGQKYRDYYFEALKQSVVSIVRKQNKSIKPEEILKRIPDIPVNVNNVLDKIEAECTDINSALFVPNNVFPTVENCFISLDKLKNGSVSIAHPLVFFPKNAIKDESKIVEMYKHIIDIFMEKLRSKLKYFEGNYQTYYKSTDYSQLNDIFRYAESKKLLKTGGLDTHSKDIFSI